MRSADYKRVRHEAAIKSWDTRRKNQGDEPKRSDPRAQSSGGSEPKASRGDWKELEKHFGKGTPDDPTMILGAQAATPKVSAYLRAAGAKMRPGSKLPANVPKGAPNDCYTNATSLVMRDPDRFDYAEGFAYHGDSNFAIQHAWAVEKATGKIVDNTWHTPETSRYFGVTYDRKKYFRHLSKTKMYGVLGGDPRAAWDVIERGGL